MDALYRLVTDGLKMDIDQVAFDQDKIDLGCSVVYEAPKRQRKPLPEPQVLSAAEPAAPSEAGALVPVVPLGSEAEAGAVVAAGQSEELQAALRLVARLQKDLRGEKFKGSLRQGTTRQLQQWKRRAGTELARKDRVIKNLKQTVWLMKL